MEGVIEEPEKVKIIFYPDEEKKQKENEIQHEITTTETETAAAGVTENNNSATFVQPDTFKDGTHKKKCQCADCVAKRLELPPIQNNAPNKPPVISKDEENPELVGFEEIEDEELEKEKKEKKKRKITGSMFLMGLEMLFPVLLKYLVGALEPKFRRLNKEGKKALALSDEMIDELMPYADDFAEELFEDLPSWIGFSIIYLGAKFMLVDELDDEKHFSVKKEKEETTEAEKILQQTTT